MEVFLNNCRCRNHEKLYGRGAFFDLGRIGPQSKLAVGLKVGQKCVVASYDDSGRVVFETYSFKRESLEYPKELPRRLLRTFRGVLLKREIMAKSKAANSRYSRFFNVRGNFRRSAVL